MKLGLVYDKDSKVIVGYYLLIRGGYEHDTLLFQGEDTVEEIRQINMAMARKLMKKIDLAFERFVGYFTGE